MTKKREPLRLHEIEQPGFFIVEALHGSRKYHGRLVYVTPYDGAMDRDCACMVIIGDSVPSNDPRCPPIGWVKIEKDRAGLLLRFVPIESASDLPEGFGLPCLSPGEQETARHNKVQAIKMYRDRTECSLRDSKDAVEAYLATC